MADLQECLPHGTMVRVEDDRLLEVVARAGQSVARLTWDDRMFVAATVRLPSGRTIVIRRSQDVHPVLGPVDRLGEEAADAPVAAFGQVDWASPQAIPPLDRPGALPTGAGAAVLNLLAIAARVADLETLRYRGPYPTGALFDALQSSFVVHGNLRRARSKFVADVERTASAGLMVSPEVAFVPAPFEWAWPDERVCVQLRDGIERIYVDGHAFEAQRAELRRVVPRPDGGADAVVEIAGQCWARVVTLSAAAVPEAPPQPLPSAPADLRGQPLPGEVVAALTQIVAERAPAPLAAMLRRMRASLQFEWGDPGLRLARATERGVEIHAGLVAALPTKSGPLLTTLLALVEPILLRAAQRELAAAHTTLVGATREAVNRW